MLTPEENKKEMFIPKPTKYIKDIFSDKFGGISFTELGIFAIFFAIIIGITVLCFFTIKQTWTKWVVALPIDAVLIIIFIWLIHTRHSDKKKQWKHSINVINYTFKNDVKVLKPSIIDDCININSIANDGTIEFYTTFNKEDNGSSLTAVGKKETKTHNHYHGCLFKLEGINIDLLTPIESNTVITNMADPWLKLNISHKIIVVDEPIDTKPMNDYLEKIIDKYDDVKDNDISTEDAIVRNQLCNYHQTNEDIGTNQNIVNKGYYLLVIYTDDEKLNDTYREINNIANQAKLIINRIDNKEKVCKVLNQFYCPLSEKKWFNSKTETGMTPDLGYIRVHKDYLNINSQYTRYIEINQCPITVSAGWLRKAANYQNIQTLVNIEPTETETVRHNLERSKRRTKLNWKYIRTEGEQFNQQEYIEAMTNQIESFAKGYSKAWLVNIIFVLSAPTATALSKLVREFTKELSSVDRFKFEIFDFQQYDVFKSIFDFKFVSKKKLLTYGEMSNDVIGAMYPFISNALKDPKGVFLGYESYSGDGFWFDLTTKEGYRNSNVCLVCAKTGGGKTYTVSKLCNWFKCVGDKQGMKQYLVDPLGDYSGFLQNYNNVAIVDMTDATKGLINPLQILDEEKSITTHATEFITFLAMVNKSEKFSASIDKLIIQSLQELYKKYKITEEYSEVVSDNGEIHNVYKYGQLANNKWPTTDDYYQFLIKEYPLTKNSKDVEITNFKDIVWKLSKEGGYGGIWSGYTTLDTKNASIIILDTHKLDPDKDPILYKCQMYLISGYLRGEALKNRDRNIGVSDPNKIQWINIVVDEAHRWVKNNPIALKTLELLAREIRHHKGVLILSTQNISDFKGEPESILKQSLYQIILNMTPADVASYDELLRESGGLTTNEKNFILSAQTGEALISIGTQYRCYVDIVANDIESYMWMNGAK